MIELTAQQWFDKAWERAGCPHRSVVRYIDKFCGDPATRCTYSAQSEAVPGCFIGVCLDGDTASMLDASNTSAAQAVGKRFIRVSDLSLDKARMYLRKIQNIHDSDPVSEWRYQLAIVAKQYGLEVPND